MKTTYIIVKSTYTDGENTRASYGIALTDGIEGSEIVLETISDLSNDRKAVEALVEKCNRLELAPEQLRDVIDDMLAVV